MALTSTSTMPAQLRSRIAKHSGWFLALGIFWIVAGIAAILVPVIASIAVELLVGSFLLVGGVLQIVHSFRLSGWKSTLFYLALGVLSVLAGVLLVLNPLAGLFTLTLVLAAFFVAEGALQSVAALNMRGESHWVWLLISGLLGIAVGVLIFLGLPATAFWALGVLAGIDLISTGIALTTISIGVRRDGDRAEREAQGGAADDSAPNADSEREPPRGAEPSRA